jgi:copper chaperone CopZ
MKKLILLAFVLFLAVVSQAQSIKEVVFTTEPEIECQNCVKRIKDNLRFEKGVKAINPDLKTKLVTVQYDSEKTDPDKLIKAFAKINYKATVVEPKNEDKEDKKDNKDKR